MTVKHLFASGNDCTVELPDATDPGARPMSMEWTNPPSAADVREFDRYVYPHVILPALVVALGLGRIARGGCGELIQ